MRPSPSLLLLPLCLLTISCGGGGGSSTTPPPPPNPTFTSTPPTSAEESTPYTYQPTATTPDNSAITFTLTAAPTGAALASSSLTWTPTHTQSRAPNAFTLTATTANGGTATQSWSVTPTGNVNITSVTTYWTPSGSIKVPITWNNTTNFPSIYLPQSNGTLTHLIGLPNPDGSFSIQNVPSGTYLLQLNATSYFFTSVSDFDNGSDVLGQPPSFTAAQNTTTFNYSITGFAPSPSSTLVAIQTDAQVDVLSSILFAGGAPAQFNLLPSTITSNDDWSKITTLYFLQYNPFTQSNLSGFSLVSSQTQSNVTITDGASNTIAGVLTPAPTASLPLAVTGSAWAAISSPTGPGTPAAVISGFSIFAQPYLTNGYANPQISPFGPSFTLLSSATQTGAPPSVSVPYCLLNSGPLNLPSILGAPLPPITTDTNFGSLTYGDPFPSAWPRLFEYCQLSSFAIPRPNSTATDTFYAVTKQVTTLPTSSVAPILSSVQNPTLNNASLLQPATLNTTTLNFAWTAPSTGTPVGYYVSIFRLATDPAGATGYVLAGIYGTSQTSLTTLLPLPSNTSYVFIITAISDANPSFPNSPNHHQIPSAQSSVISAPITLTSN